MTLNFWFSYLCSSSAGMHCHIVQVPCSTDSESVFNSGVGPHWANPLPTWLCPQPLDHPLRCGLRKEGRAQCHPCGIPNSIPNFALGPVSGRGHMGDWCSSGFRDSKVACLQPSGYLIFLWKPTHAFMGLLPFRSCIFFFFKFAYFWIYLFVAVNICECFCLHVCMCTSVLRGQKTAPTYLEMELPRVVS